MRVVEVDRERGRIGLRLADDPEVAGQDRRGAGLGRHRRAGGPRGRDRGGDRGGGVVAATAATGRGRDRGRDRDRDRGRVRDRDPERPRS